jgi:hypothetical protein
MGTMTESRCDKGMGGTRRSGGDGRVVSVDDYGADGLVWRDSKSTSGGPGRSVADGGRSPLAGSRRRHQTRSHAGRYDRARNVPA